MIDQKRKMMSTMDKANTRIEIVIIGILLLVAGCSGNAVTLPESSTDAKDDLDVKEKIMLGYCPTMSGHAHSISTEEVDIIPFGSTFEILENLKEGKIDMALVGRLAKKSEISDGFKKIMIADGLTLISDSKRYVDIEDLKDVRVATYLSEEQIVEYKEDFLGVIYTNDIDIAFRSDEKGAVLIDWKDYQDDFEILIPIKEGKKVEKYRIPVLYFKNEHDDKATGIGRQLKAKTI